jgi:hypothetical protein
VVYDYCLDGNKDKIYNLNSPESPDVLYDQRPIGEEKT